MSHDIPVTGWSVHIQHLTGEEAPRQTYHEKSVVFYIFILLWLVSSDRPVSTSCQRWAHEETPWLTLASHQQGHQSGTFQASSLAYFFACLLFKCWHVTKVMHWVFWATDFLRKLDLYDPFLISAWGQKGRNWLSHQVVKRQQSVTWKWLPEDSGNWWQHACLASLQFW